MILSEVKAVTRTEDQRRECWLLLYSLIWVLVTQVFTSLLLDKSYVLVLCTFYISHNKMCHKSQNKFGPSGRAARVTELPIKV